MDSVKLKNLLGRIIQDLYVYHLISEIECEELLKEVSGL